MGNDKESIKDGLRGRGHLVYDDVPDMLQKTGLIALDPALAQSAWFRPSQKIWTAGRCSLLQHAFRTATAPVPYIACITGPQPNVVVELSTDSNRIQFECHGVATDGDPLPVITSLQVSSRLPGFTGPIVAAFRNRGLELGIERLHDVFMRTDVIRAPRVAADTIDAAARGIISDLRP